MQNYKNRHMYRNKKGQFARRIKPPFFWTSIILVSIMLTFHYGGGFDAVSRYVDSASEPIIIREQIDTAKPKIEAMKWEIVDEIAQCESGGIPDGRRNALVVMDTNGYYSRGKWQFQLRTIQYYIKKFEGREITLDEASLIAHTEDKARNLAYRIVWDEVGGVYNWANCERKLGLRSKIEVIRKLDE